MAKIVFAVYYVAKVVLAVYYVATIVSVICGEGCSCSAICGEGCSAMLRMHKLLSNLIMYFPSECNNFHNVADYETPTLLFDDDALCC